MRRLLPITLALFFLASTSGIAQLSKPLSGTPYGEPVQSTVTSYALSQAMPIAKSLIGKKIVVVGMAQGVTTVSKTPVWFLLVDGTVKCAIVNKMTIAAPTGFIGKKVGVLGTFAINSITNAMEFLATGLTVASTESPTSQEISKAPVVYGEPIPTLAKVLPLSTALPNAKAMIGTKFVVTGAVSSIASTSSPNAWFWLTDGTAKVAVIKKISTTVPNPPGGEKVSLYGGFAQNPTTSAIEFHAVSLRIP